LKIFKFNTYVPGEAQTRELKLLPTRLHRSNIGVTLKHRSNIGVTLKYRRDDRSNIGVTLKNRRDVSSLNIGVTIVQTPA
jgi:hypothetical protein